MPDQPNITKLVLDHVIERDAADESTSLHDLAEETGINLKRLYDRESVLYPAVNCGMSPCYPWPWKAERALEWYDSWDADPPDCFDDADWFDRDD